MTRAGGDELLRWLMATYAASLASYLASLASRKSLVARAATALAGGGLLLHTAWLLLRWRQAGMVEVGAREAVGEVLSAGQYAWLLLSHPPFTNLYESLVFGAWCVMLGYLAVEARWKVRPVGVLATGLALIALGEAYLSAEKAIEPLVPALQSWWMLLHVALLFVAYGLFLLAAAVAVLYLLRTGVRTASLGLGFSAAGAVVLGLTGAATGLFHRFAFELNPVFTGADGKTQLLQLIAPDGQTLILPRVAVPGIGPLLALAALLCLVAAVFYALELRRRNEALRSPGYRVLASAAVALGATLIVLLIQVIPGKPVTIDLPGGSLPAAAAGPFRLSLEGNFGIGLLGLLLLALGAFAGLVRFHESILARLPPAEELDEISYKVIAVGFPMLSFGIVMGAFWAYDAWGRYWGWDPKETWSLITWFIYALYLHTRMTMEWKGRRAATIAVLGFALVIFTYLGVNLGLTGEGLHTYGAS